MGVVSGAVTTSHTLERWELQPQACKAATPSEYGGRLYMCSCSPRGDSGGLAHLIAGEGDAAQRGGSTPPGCRRSRRPQRRPRVGCNSSLPRWRCIAGPPVLIVVPAARYIVVVATPGLGTGASRGSVQLLPSIGAGVALWFTAGKPVEAQPDGEVTPQQGGHSCPYRGGRRGVEGGRVLRAPSASCHHHPLTRRRARRRGRCVWVWQKRGEARMEPLEEQ